MPAPKQFRQTPPGGGQDDTVLGAQDVAGVQPPYQSGLLPAAAREGSRKVRAPVLGSHGVQGDHPPRPRPQELDAVQPSGRGPVSRA